MRTQRRIVALLLLMGCAHGVTTSCEFLFSASNEVVITHQGIFSGFFTGHPNFHRYLHLILVPQATVKIGVSNTDCEES